MLSESYRAVLMKVKAYLKFFLIGILLSVVCGRGFCQEAPVVPIPLNETKPAGNDSAAMALMKARYDSLVAHINRTYLDEAPAGTASLPGDGTEAAPAKEPDEPSQARAIEQAEGSGPLNESITTQPPGLKPEFTQTSWTMPGDTPRIRVPQDTLKADTMLLDRIGTEDPLVDTTATEAVNDVSDGDEADEEGEAEGEFDQLFTGYSDVSYWDMLRDPNFTFHHEMIPAPGHYPYDWDTIVINPYKVSLAEMNDTILLRLKDSMDCSFHPPAIGDITSTFGFRRWGKKPKFHYGVDVRMEVGDPVYAIFDGVVRVAKKSVDYGYVVLIRHYNGLETLYAHFDQLLAYPGKPVRSGEIIGLSGNTGRSTGPHLHFEVRYKGEKIDPNKVINFPSGSLMSDTLQVDKSCFSHLYKVQQTKLRSRYYVVKKGDTLGKIAYTNGVTVKQITRLNRISVKTKLQAGRKLRIR